MIVELNISLLNEKLATLISKNIFDYCPQGIGNINKDIFSQQIGQLIIKTLNC